MRVTALRRADGFSLVEVLAALVVFTIITLGLVPLLAASIRGSNTARSDTVGKNAATKAMERVRGLPFFISYATDTGFVDVLDLYYPSYTGTVVAGTPPERMYRTVCPSGGPANPACPVDIPAGYTLTFEARFVDPVPGGTQPNPGELATSYQTVEPATTYNRASTTTETPPRQLLRMDIIASWTVGGDAESYRLSSLVSDRQFGGIDTRANATLGYGVEIHTSFDTRTGQGQGGQSLKSVLSSIALTGESEIEGQRLSTARQVSSAGRIGLFRDTGGAIGTAFSGATTASLLAPPNTTPPTADVAQAAGQVLHPDFSNAQTAGMTASEATGIRAEADVTAQHAEGAVGFPTAAAGTEYFWSKDPQLINNDYSALHLQAPQGGTLPSLVSVVRNDGLPVSGGNLEGMTTARSFATSVVGSVTAGFDRLQFLRMESSVIPATDDVRSGTPQSPGPVIGTLSANSHLIVIDDFQAQIDCASESDGTGTATASYTATLYYWADSTNGNGVGAQRDGDYFRVDLNVNETSTGTDPLAGVRTMNPVVYDGPNPNQDIFMFGGAGQRFGPGGSGTFAAYLSEWSSVTQTQGRIDPRTNALGDPVAAANASIDSAISLTSGDFDTARNVESAISVSIGSMSCLAEDLR